MSKSPFFLLQYSLININRRSWSIMFSETHWQYSLRGHNIVKSKSKSNNNQSTHIEKLYFFIDSHLVRAKFCDRSGYPE